MVNTNTEHLHRRVLLGLADTFGMLVGAPLMDGPEYGGSSSVYQSYP